ncbi:MAG: LysR family transcriptional regulator [Gemmobacter sp.]|nr:LysR family transcriptional regulator [Gemmobacter sp.]
MDTALMQCFVYVVEEGSFSAAANRMGISRSMCSKHISDLEQMLGSRLLTRSTRSVQPTPLGIEYFGKAKSILNQIEEAMDSVRRYSETPTGRLRIAVAVSYSHRALPPLIARFMRTYPDVQLDLVLDDQYRDLVKDGIDAAIRIGDLDDSNLYARRLYSAQMYLVASPDYVTQHGAPSQPSDLAQHRCLYYTNTRGTGTWRFRRGNDVIHQKVHPIFSANTGDMIVAAALAGQGVAPMPDFLIADELASGRLVPLMPDYTMPEIPVSVVYLSRKHQTAALRAFLDMLTSWTAEIRVGLPPASAKGSPIALTG